ncbi:unnamed protein product [Caenorhabditis auriculariae]|uniref:Cytoplasmic polyadenylation element-binding protein 3 n=1 Tax=Caenorhabditis auriculariae TaxID=2777116 RepID=A0A8S1HP48_9PELO|nr:unnamed protein product [Caenorhabditis auriculariae]
MDENSNYLEPKLHQNEVVIEPVETVENVTDFVKNETLASSELVLSAVTPHEENQKIIPEKRDVMSFLMRYNNKDISQDSEVLEESKQTKEKHVKIGFDKMSLQEQTKFMQELKQLTVINNTDSKGPEDIKKELEDSTRKKDQSKTKNVIDVLFSRNSRKFSYPKTDKSKSLGSSPNKENGDLKAAITKLDSQDKTKYVLAMAQEYERKMAAAAANNVAVVKPFKKSPSQLQPLQVSTVSLPATSLDSPSAWEGELPPREYNNPTFSRKIFVGGVPWDITETALKSSFSEFGSCTVEWPGQEARYARATTVPKGKVTGYVYMIFEDEKAVAALLRECSQEIGGAGEWYFKIRAQRTKSTEIRQVQIIPWVTCDSEYLRDMEVFVGALHGMMTAQVLHSIMENMFGEVECVMLDTDKYKYPIGSGRVTFQSHKAYFNAIDVGFLEVRTSKFKKRVQIDPFLEESTCMQCNGQIAKFFCRARICFKYYCELCWAADHHSGPNKAHLPVFVPTSVLKSASPVNSKHSTSANASPVKYGPCGDDFSLGQSPMAPSTGSQFYGYMPTMQQPIMPPMGRISPAMSPQTRNSVSSASGFSASSSSPRPDLYPHSFGPYNGSMSPPEKSHRTFSGSSKSDIMSPGASPFFGSYPPSHYPTTSYCGGYYYPYSGQPSFYFDYGKNFSTRQSYAQNSQNFVYCEPNQQPYAPY